MLLSVDGFSLSFRRYDGFARHRDFVALRDISFNLSCGEIVALVGTSGAGKSLLAHALFGILPPNAVASGTLALDGGVHGPSQWPQVRGRRMGLVPQSPSHLDPLVRCGHHLAWAAERSGRKVDATALAATLARFALDDSVLRAFPHQLSGGMARRVMLAMATIGAPDLVVADEITTGLDAENARGVLDHLLRLAADGKGVLLITHDLVQALPIAHRVVILRHGSIVGVERAADFVRGGEQLRSAYARALWQAMPDNDFIVAADA